MTNWKYLPLIIFVFFSGAIYPTNDTNNVTNKLLPSSEHYFGQLYYFKSINSAEKASISSKQSGYSKGIAMSNIYLANALLEVGDYKGALNSLTEVEASHYFNLDVHVQVETYRLKEKVYNTFEMHSLAEEQFQKQLVNANNLENLGLQEQSLEAFDESKYFYTIGNTYCQIATEFIERNDLVKAKEYIDKSMKLHEKYNSVYLFVSLEAYGYLEETAGNIDLAEMYYKKALENVLHTNNQKARSYYYKVLSDFYLKHKPRSSNGEHYDLQHHKINDAIVKMNNSVSLDEYIIKDGQNIQKASLDSFQYILITIVMLSTVAIVYIQQNRDKHRELINIQSFEISEHKKRIVKLNNDVSENKLEELNTYANANSSEFLTAFQKLYPEVVEDLKKKNVNITTSTLSFCALTYLNFSTKEMASIQNVTIRAIQVRKNRIRNQFDIPSDVDFNIWMNQNLGSS